MAPTLYHSWPVPMDNDSKKLVLGDHKLPSWLGILLILLVVGLLVTVIILAVRPNSNACKDGLHAEQECRNITHLLEHQLSQAQEVLLGTEAQATICNQTVVTLMASLEMEKPQSHKQQELVQQLQGTIKELQQKLENTSLELKTLRKQNEASGRENGSTSSGNTLSPWVVTVLLTLSLPALLA